MDRYALLTISKKDNEILVDRATMYSELEANRLVEDLTKLLLDSFENLFCESVFVADKKTLRALAEKFIQQVENLENVYKLFDNELDPTEEVGFQLDDNYMTRVVKICNY